RGPRGRNEGPRLLADSHPGCLCGSPSRADHGRASSNHSEREHVMFNSTKARTAIAALAISITAFGGVASAQAGGKADTKVSIKGDNGDYYGYVKSSDAGNCANDRKVKVFKQTG